MVLGVSKIWVIMLSGVVYLRVYCDVTSEVNSQSNWGLPTEFPLEKCYRALFQGELSGQDPIEVANSVHLSSKIKIIIDPGIFRASKNL